MGKPERGASGDPNPADALILAFQTPERERMSVVEGQDHLFAGPISKDRDILRYRGFRLLHELPGRTSAALTDRVAGID